MELARLTNVPETPGGNNRNGGCGFNQEREADARDDVPEIRDGLGGPFRLRRVGLDRVRGRVLAAN